MERKWYERPWYEWVGWVIWFMVTIVFLQSAFASQVEVEHQAAAISFGVVAVLLIFAVLVWGRRLLDTS